MNVLILNGSLRKKGNTNNACAILKEILKRREHTFTEISEYVSDCINCGFCKEKHKCCLKDSMSVDFNSYDSVILLSPMYFFNISGKARLMLDRLNANYNLDMIITAITTSGSEDFEDSGVDLFWDNLEYICNFCGYNAVDPINFVTFDEIISYGKDEVHLIQDLVRRVEEVYSEIKKGK